MHKMQAKLLQRAREGKLNKKTLEDIGQLIGGESPQLVHYHLGQLAKRGLIKLDPANRRIEPIGSVGGSKKDSLRAIPILGSANAGEATAFAEEAPEGFLHVSRSLVPSRGKLFALKVVGNSMNRAVLGEKGKSIDNGDYAIVDANVTIPKNGDYVLSVIDDAANIKRYIRDEANHQIILVSDSTEEHHPIFIDLDDVSDGHYFVNGRVVDVMKPKPATQATPL